jgi:hypothetical protein
MRKILGLIEVRGVKRRIHAQVCPEGHGNLQGLIPRAGFSRPTASTKQSANAP